MRLIFAGTPAFAVPALQALAAEHAIELVLTQPNRPAGRGLTTQPSPVRQLADRRGFEVYQPATLKAAEAVERLRSVHPDLLVVVAYGLLLPPAVLDLAPGGALNIHASLLPRWRGAAPIQRAILAGDSETGISIMRMDAGLDTGPVLLRESIPISPEDTAGTLQDRLAQLGAKLIARALSPGVFAGLVAEPQPASGVTYAPKVDKSEAVISWGLEAEVIARIVRAFNPLPGATAWLGDHPVKLWRAYPSVESTGGQPPGTVIAVGDHVKIACGSGVLCVAELQRAGGRRLPAREFLRGHAIAPGDRFADRDFRSSPRKGPIDESASGSGAIDLPAKG